LDEGEAAVIQTAGDLSISRVCIDEAAGRRMARLHGLAVTGSLGILIKSIKRGSGIDLELCIKKMRLHGVWIGEQTAQKSLRMILDV
jgi:predicted nucleic acid-binding protein